MDQKENQKQNLDNTWEADMVLFVAICSAIETPFSYGHENDRIEIMGLLTEEEEANFDSVTGNLTAEDVFERIKAHWDTST